MNSAPAELLHPLNYAALQPYWLRQRYEPLAIAKKNASCYAGVGILFRKDQTFFKKKAALPNNVGIRGTNR
jgi:hypothetical protein